MQGLEVLQRAVLYQPERDLPTSVGHAVASLRTRGRVAHTLFDGARHNILTFVKRMVPNPPIFPLWWIVVPLAMARPWARFGARLLHGLGSPNQTSVAGLPAAVDALP